jgi:hypothetical protein
LKLFAAPHITDAQVNLSRPAPNLTAACKVARHIHYLPPERNTRFLSHVAYKVPPLLGDNYTCARRQLHLCNLSSA